METNVNSKSQDRFIFKFSRYFTHYLYRTNIEIHEARDKKKLLALIILMLGAKKWPNFKFSIFQLSPCMRRKMSKLQFLKHHTYMIFISFFFLIRAGIFFVFIYFNSKIYIFNLTPSHSPKKQTYSLTIN